MTIDWPFGRNERATNLNFTGQWIQWILKESSTTIIFHYTISNICSTLQRQSFVNVLLKGCSLKIRKTFNGKHLYRSFSFNKVAGLKKETPTQAFSCEFCEIFMKNFFTDLQNTLDDCFMSYSRLPIFLHLFIQNTGNNWNTEAH